MGQPASSHSDYQIEKVLSRQGDHLIYRALRLIDRVPVMLKLFRTPTGTDDASTEYRLLCDLAPEWILSPVDLVEIEAVPTIVFNDPGGYFLSAQLSDTPMPLSDFLDLALAVTTSLQHIHDAGVVHRAIQPANLYVDPYSSAIRLTGFDLATRLPRTFQRTSPHHIRSGTLGYLAPEQTGRINRQVDGRTDLYSLGVLLYRLLTGALPFTADNSLELCHALITRQPVPPHSCVNSVPEPISQVVTKLLQKNAEERYRSAEGLAADVHRCRESLHASGVIAPFVPGADDPIEQLEIPERLYGREEAIDGLMAAFERARQGAVELLAVAGYSGIGKTSLVLEVQKPILQARGYFAAGKFDQLSRDEPYSALIQALSDLVRQLLTEPDEAIADWRTRIVDALGKNARVVLDVVPELESIIGPRPPVPELGPAESRNRLELQFQRLLAALARREHPLVLFLDDLQWADNASLQLMASLLIYATPQSFLLIGAYRDNEVDNRHPLSSTLRQLESSGARLTHCRLGPLRLEHVEAWLADAFDKSTESVAALAALVQEKTLGNPFFARIFLDTAFNSGLIRHDVTDGWIWHTDDMRRAQPTDNVVELLASRIDRLPEDSRRVMELGACIGNRFNASTLATVMDVRIQVVHEALLPPLREGLVGQQRNDDWAFSHDRIQEAAHKRIPEAERAAMHLRIGTLLRKQTGDELESERLFSITDHLNQAQSLLANDDARRLLGDLNRRAGACAHRSAAFEAAHRYYDHGIRGLGGGAWAIDGSLAFSLLIGRAEAAFLTGRTESAEADTETLLQQARSELERGEVYLLAMVQYENSGRFADAVRAGGSALQQLGIDMPEDPDVVAQAIDTALADIQGLMRRRSVPMLLDLPRMQDPRIRMGMRLLMTLWPSAYIAGDKAKTVLIASRMVLLSLQYGNAPESAYGYVTHAITLGALQQDYSTAYEFGRLALDINRQFDDLRSRAKINHMFSCYIGIWRKPISESFAYSEEAHSAGMESGDFVYAAYGCFHESWHAMFSGMNLQQYHEKYEDMLAFLERTGNRSFYDAHQLMLHWGMSLQGKTDVPGELSGPRFDETGYLQKYQQADFFVAFHHIARLSLLCVFGDFAKAIDMARHAGSVALGVRGMIWDAWLCFYSALALMARVNALPELTLEEQQQLDLSIGRMALWADNCPANFSHQHDLLQAERLRLQGRASDAIDAYESAISGAEAAGFVHDQALTKERYAEFWLARNKPKLAGFYVGEALADYQRWGATAKVAQLAGRHGNLAIEAVNHLSNESKNPDLDPLDSTAILSSTRALSEETDAERLVRVLLTLLIQAAGAQRAILFEHGDGRLSPRLQAEVTEGGLVLGPLATGDWRDHAAERVLNLARNTRRSQLVGDARIDDNLSTDPYVAQWQVRSIACVPVIRQSQLEGVVYLENNQTKDAFTPALVALVEVLAAQAAISLGNARLFTGLQREVSQRERAERRIREVALGTAAAIGENFFQELVLHLSRALNVRIAFVTECLSVEQKRVRALAFVNDGQYVDDVEYELDGTPCKGVIDGNICFYSDLLETLFPRERGLVSYLGVPMHGADGTIVGHLAVVDDKPMQKSPDDVALLEIFAIRATAELERQRAQMEAARTQSRLAERERLASIGEFASMITHEIRSPLSTIAMALDYINGGQLSDAARKRIRLASVESERLQSLLSEILLFAKPHELRRNKLDLDVLISETIDELQQLPTADRRPISYRCATDSSMLIGDRDKLKQVLLNLMSNACQAIAEHEQVSVELRIGDRPHDLEVSVLNPGHIPEQELQRLTEPFFTTKSGGTGLGLAIVKRIVDSHDGALEISCESQQGVNVVVKLPTGGA